MTASVTLPRGPDRRVWVASTELNTDSCRIFFFFMTDA